MIFDEHYQAGLAARASQIFTLEEDLYYERMRPFYLIRPRMFLEGDQWCALYGDNLQDGVCGFGSTPHDASVNFDFNWRNHCVGEKK